MAIISSVMPPHPLYLSRLAAIAVASTILTTPAFTADFTAVIPLSSINGKNGFRLDGAVAFDFSGKVADAGDVNGDGFADILVGLAVQTHMGMGQDRASWCSARRLVLPPISHFPH